MLFALSLSWVSALLPEIPRGLRSSVYGILDSIPSKLQKK